MINNFFALFYFSKDQKGALICIGLKMENIYDKKSSELPTWIGVCQVRYYTKQEVREILEGLVNSHIFRPYFYSEKAVMVTKYEKGHPY